VGGSGGSGSGSGGRVGGDTGGTSIADTVAGGRRGGTSMGGTGAIAELPEFHGHVRITVCRSAAGAADSAARFYSMFLRRSCPPQRVGQRYCDMADIAI
jgi:hypothetical protein